MHIKFLDAAVAPSHSLIALNGTMVGLCISGMAAEGNGRGVEECVGLGLVRAVDVQRRLLFVITPVDLEVVRVCLCVCAPPTSRAD